MITRPLLVVGALITFDGLLLLRVRIDGLDLYLSLVAVREVVSAIRLIISVYIDPRLLLAVRAVGVLSDRLGSPLFARKILELDEEPILIFIPLVVPVEPSFTAFPFDEVARVVVGIFGVEDGGELPRSRSSL